MPRLDPGRPDLEQRPELDCHHQHYNHRRLPSTRDISTTIANLNAALATVDAIKPGHNREYALVVMMYSVEPTA
jgi:hypothetical protein